MPYLFSSLWQWITMPVPLLVYWMMIELVFYLVFVFYIVPKVNQRTPPRAYRDYDRHRHQLLLRIVNRIERTCRVKRRNLRDTIETFLIEWFHEEQQQEQQPPIVVEYNEKQLLSKLPPLARVSSLSSSAESSDNDEPPSITEHEQQQQQQQLPLEQWCSKKGLYQDDMDDFFAWGFFGKPLESLETWEQDEMNCIYQHLQQRLGLTFPPGRSSQHFKPRIFTLENVNPLHRPLFVYLLVALLKLFGYVVLYLRNFRRRVAQNGLVYWYRPARRDGPKLRPLLFFHGIAPGSLSVYLPILFSGLASDNRDVFLFENRPISCAIGFRAFSEDETIQGVEEALRTHPVDHDLCLCGHSFGTCQLTWLLHSSSIRNRIRQLVLLDPVTILLSEPDVVLNFLYSRQRKPPPPQASWIEGFRAWFARAKIRLVASSEVFTEYYLRRHFAWYNSELWLDDIPPNVQVLVCLAECDEITNAAKIREEVEIHNAQHAAAVANKTSSHVDVLEWRNKGHAYCLMAADAWKDVKLLMTERNPMGTDTGTRHKCD